MKFLRFTLLTDGSSDKSLISHLTWLLEQNGVNLPIDFQWANEGLSRLREKPADLSERIQRSVELYPCELLFIHRDAERETYEERKDEIKQALNRISNKEFTSICVIPVKMTEAWMLFDIPAIRRASGNPNGTESLSLPKLKNIEVEPDPKTLLHNLLRAASARTGRRLHNFKARHHALLVAENIEDFSQLRNLSAFALLEAEIQKALKQLNLIDE